MKQTNDFICNIENCKDSEIRLPKKTMLLCLIFTGLCAIQAVVNITQWTLWQAWNIMGAAKFLYHLTWNVAILIFFFTILFLYWSHKPFNRVLAKGIYIIGLLFILVSFIVARISPAGFIPSGIFFMRWHDFVLADGSYLILGVICILIASIFRAGYRLQNEVDATI